MELPASRSRRQLSDLDLLVSHFRSVLAEKHKRIAKLEQGLHAQNGYESIFCEFFGLEPIKSKTDFQTRYGDAIYSNGRGLRIKIELKKTTASAFWIDAVRYAETVQAKAGKLDNETKAQFAAEDSVTVFIQVGKSHLKIYCLETRELIRFLDLDAEDIAGQLRFFKRHNCSVNCQLSFTLNSLERGTTGCLILFKDKEVIFENLVGQKFHHDFPKNANKDPEDEMPVLFKLIKASEKETFTARELWSSREGICSYGENKIRKLLREVADLEDEEALERTSGLFALRCQRGRYWLA